MAAPPLWTKKIERPLLSQTNIGSSLSKYFGVLVFAFLYLKPTATSWSEKVFEGLPSYNSNRPPPHGQEKGMGEHVLLKRRRAVTAAMLLRDACLGGPSKAHALVPWLMGAAFWSAYPYCRVYAAALGNGAGNACSRRRTWTMTEANGARKASSRCRKNHLAKGKHARSASSRRRYYAVRIVNRRRRSPSALDRGNSCWAVLDRQASGTRASSDTKRMSPTLPSTDRPGVPYRRRAVNFRYGNCQAGTRQDVRPGYERPQRVFQEQERDQKRRARVGYHHGVPRCMCYRCHSLPGPEPGSTLAIDLNDGDDFCCGCSGEKRFRLRDSRSCVLDNVSMRHRHKVGQVQGSNGRSH